MCCRSFHKNFKITGARRDGYTLRTPANNVVPELDRNTYVHVATPESSYSSASGFAIEVINESVTRLGRFGGLDPLKVFPR